MKAIFPIKAPPRAGPQRSIHLRAESDEYKSVSVVGVRPRRRDFWRVLLGRYEPMVQRRAIATVAGVSHVLKDVYNPAALERLEQAKAPLLRDLD